MAVLTNKSIASTYKSVLSIGATTESALTTSIQQLTDGLGNSSPLSMSTTQIQFNNDANTFSFPADRGTSGQILKLADANGTLSWADDDNSGTVTSVALSVPTGLTVTNSPITTSGTITIGGTLGVANGGTGATTLTGILVGNGTSAISVVSDGIVSGQVLSTNANGTYSFIDAATGDVSISGTPSTNEVAIWTNSNTIKGDASFTMSSSTFQINNSTASSQSNLIISNNDTAINSIPANIIFNSNTLTSYKTLAQIYATKTDADIANASGKLNFSTTDAGVPSVKFIINSNGLSEFLGNVNAYNTSSLKLYSLGQEGYSNTEFLEIKKSSTNAIFNVNKVGTGSVRGLEFQTGGSPKLTISSGGDATFSGALNGTSAKFTSTCFVNSPANDTIITTSDATNITNGFNLLGSSSYWGIRTSSSGDIKLDVFGGGTPINALSITQSTGAATFNETTTLNATGNSYTDGSLVLRNSDGTTNTYLTNAAGAFYLSNDGASAALTISSGGDVTIGSATYGANLGQLRIINAASSNPASLSLFGYDNVVDGGNFAKIDFSMQTSGTGGQPVADIKALAVGTGENAADLVFSTATGGTLSPRLTISSGGDATFSKSVLIEGKDNEWGLNCRGGTTTSQSYGLLVKAGTSSSDYTMSVQSTSNTQYLYVRGDGYLFSSSSWSGSDIRLKENIINLDDGLNKVLALQPKKFDFIDGFKNEFGFIAQEVKEVIPEAVSVYQEENEMLAIKMDFIIPHLTKAIQEQQTIIEDLKARIETLEG